MKAIEFNWPILGQNRIKNFLQKSIANQAFAHAYIFAGPKKTGKTKAAKLMAKSILCEKYSQFYHEQSSQKAVVPCGQCLHCVHFEKGIHPDVYFLEREKKKNSDELKSQIVIGQIRSLQEKINKRAFLNSYKIIIASEADLLNEDAGNALLKTLEEPSRKTVLFLIVRDKRNILETIVSRCQVINFSAVSKTDIYDYLIQQNASREQARVFSKIAHGRPTRAMKLFSNDDEFLRFKENQMEFLNALDKELFEKFIFAQAESVHSNDDLIKKIDEWMILIRDLLMNEIGIIHELVNEHLIENFNQLKGKRSPKELLELLKDLEKIKTDIKHNINIKLLLENFFLKHTKIC